LRRLGVEALRRGLGNALTPKRPNALVAVIFIKLVDYLPIGICKELNLNKNFHFGQKVYYQTGI